MKHHLLVLLFTIVSLQVFGQSQTQETYASSITAEELKEKLYTYASDEFEGRETGLRGQKIAVEYLRETYKKLRVDAAKEDGDYFQNVPLVLVNPPKVSINIDSIPFKYYQDFISTSDAETNTINTTNTHWDKIKTKT